MTSEQLEKNKQNAIAFYKLMFNECKPAEAIEKFTGNQYIQHNPHVPDGKAGFIQYFEKMNREYPNKKVHIKRAIAENDLVVLHTYQEWPTDEDYATIDIFRFDENGKIVEHWDVLQPIPNEMVHDNGMF